MQGGEREDVFYQRRDAEDRPGGVRILQYLDIGKRTDHEIVNILDPFAATWQGPKPTVCGKVLPAVHCEVCPCQSRTPASSQQLCPAT
jgi:hypothetical protein